MQSIFRRTLFVLLILVMLAAASVTAAQEKEPIEIDTEDWQTVESENYRLLLPEEWKNVDDMTETEIETYIEDNPQIGATIEIGAELYLINEETAGSLNVTFFDAEIPVTLEEVEEVFVSGYPDMGITVEETEIVAFTDRDVLRMTLTLDFPLSDGDVLPLTQFQYAIIDDTLVHLLTINNGTEPLSDAAATFDAIVDSLELIDGEAALTPEAETDADVEFQLVEADGISMEVPANWIDVSQDLMDEGVQAALEANPELAAMMESQANANFVINMFDLVSGANLNVNVIEFPPGLTLEVIGPVLEDEYATLGIDVLETAIIEINDEDVLRVQAQLALNDLNGEEMLLDQFQYIYLEGTQAYIITMTAGDAPLEEIQPIFEAIAESVVIE